MSSVIFSDLIDPRTYDALTDRHEEYWTYQRLDRNLNLIEEVDGVDACSVELNFNSDVRGSGSFSYLGSIDWRKGNLIRPVYTVKAGDSVASWPLGVYVPMSPQRKHGATGSPWEFQMYDRMMLLRDIKMSNTYTAAKGINAIGRVKYLLTFWGLPQYVIDDSDEVLRTAITWEPGTTVLRIVNDLLAAVNYFSIYADGNGYFRSQPYQRPQDRAVEFGFVDDEKGIYAPEFTEDYDDYAVPNRVVVVSEGDSDAPAIRGFAQDNDPNSPFSTVTTGRILTAEPESVELTSEAVAMAYAKRRLGELQQITSGFDIEHAPIPLVGGDVVTFANSTSDISIRAVVQKVSYSSELGALCSTTLREVVGA
ncbi:hypothetical protein HD598_002173 [Neomicrococcus aestuarii]|uniref:Minor tail protein n=1 Tax=Neomicrococcus aestuarii TaxID=556325 RepID=A0A7W8WZK7_9MICC|nr:hypothetical protein [Neomicrococcus aestuarii]MBB5513486.1 hypothetical protein [Neomicrococcus aestuarii]